VPRPRSSPSSCAASSFSYSAATPSTTAPSSSSSAVTHSSEPNFLPKASVPASSPGALNSCHGKPHSASKTAQVFCEVFILRRKLLMSLDRAHCPPPPPQALNARKIAAMRFILGLRGDCGFILARASASRGGSFLLCARPFSRPWCAPWCSRGEGLRVEEPAQSTPQAWYQLALRLVPLVLALLTSPTHHASTAASVGAYSLSMPPSSMVARREAIS